MDSVAIRFDSMAFQSFDCLACLSLDFRSFEHRGITCGLWLGLPCFAFPLGSKFPR